MRGDTNEISANMVRFKLSDLERLKLLRIKNAKGIPNAHFPPFFEERP
jgi:hypothetical protein